MESVQAQPILDTLDTHNKIDFKTLQTVPITPQDYVRHEARKYGWDKGNEWEALHTLVTNESGWNSTAMNKSSGACGLFQALPCSKLGSPLSDIQNQAAWGTRYIHDRYGSPSVALNFWLAQTPHWY